MKLYASPGACSLSPHIALREAGLPFEIEFVDLGSKKTRSGADFREINPKGYVPTLKLDNGEVLTEGPAIVQYIADQKPSSKLAPAAGTLERYRLQEWLNFISTEVHKSFSPLFSPKNSDDVKQGWKDRIAMRFEFVDSKLTNGPYLMGESFTVADAYLYTVLRWARPMQIDLSRWPNIHRYFERVGSRPNVKAAIEAEQKK